MEALIAEEGLRLWAEFYDGLFVKFPRSTNEELRELAKQKNMTVEELVAWVVEDWFDFDDELISQANDSMSKEIK